MSFIKTNESLVRTFAGQKFEAIGVAVCAFIWWFSMRETESGQDYALLFTAQGLQALVIALLALSSWFLNLRAESSCAFDTCHSTFYAGHASIQDFIMFLCLFAFVIKDILLAMPISIVWRIVGIIIIVAVMIFKYSEAASVLRWTFYEKRQPSNTNQCSDITFAYFLCILVRYAALGFTIYYIIYN